MIIEQQLEAIAQQRDDEFGKAIEKQFGAGANRFDYDKSEYNYETQMALELKKSADEAMLRHRANKRRQGDLCACGNPVSTFDWNRCEDCMGDQLTAGERAEGVQ